MKKYRYMQTKLYNDTQLTLGKTARRVVVGIMELQIYGWANPNIATLCCTRQQDDQSTKQLVGRLPLIAHNPLYNLYTLSTKNITTLQKDNGLQTTSQLRADASSKLMAHCSIPLYPFQTAERQRSPKQLIFGRIPTQSYKSGKAL